MEKFEMKYKTELTFGSPINAIAILSFLFCPPERCFENIAACSRSPTSDIALWTSSGILRRGMPWKIIFMKYNKKEMLHLVYQSLQINHTLQINYFFITLQKEEERLLYQQQLIISSSFSIETELTFKPKKIRLTWHIVKMNLS